MRVAQALPNMFYQFQEMEGQVIVCQTVEAWEEQLEKAKNEKKLVVADFTATWCPPCRLIAPVFTELAKKLTHIIFLKVDVDDLKSVAEEWDVESMPTFIFIKEKKKVDKVVGARKDELQLALAKHDPRPSSATAST